MMYWRPRMQTNKCNYGDCEKEATTKGFVLTRENHFVDVVACDEHKKLNSFFEEKPTTK
jgi:hypothetical protein